MPRAHVAEQRLSKLHDAQSAKAKRIRAICWQRMENSHLFRSGPDILQTPPIDDPKDQHCYGKELPPLPDTYIHLI